MTIFDEQTLTLMGNSKSHYERHENDHERQQRPIVIEKDFRLLHGEVDLTKPRKVLPPRTKRHRKLSSSSSNSTTGSVSSTDLQHSYASLIQFDIPNSPVDSNELDTQILVQYLIHQQSTGKELAHLFPIYAYRKSSTKISSTAQQIAAVYYEQTSITTDLNIERISLVDENELEQFYSKNILTIYSSSNDLFHLI